MRNQRNQARHHVGLILAFVGLISGATLALKPARLASAQAVPPSWSFTGNLNAGRDSHTATLLPNGKVLVAGGVGGGAVLNSAELYDPVTGTWSNTGKLNSGRYSHTATLLSNGKVLIARGGGGDHTYLSSAEVYDPATGTWSSTGNTNRSGGGTATLLPNGKTLVAGGGPAGKGAEVYDPATETWSITGNLSVGRLYGHTATLLPNGKILIVGGIFSNGLSQGELSSAELYDPATGMWTITGNLNTARADHIAMLLPNGKVLVAGGAINCGNYCSIHSAELYDPATGSWSLTGNLNDARALHTVTLLSNGKVLIAGGVIGVQSLNGAELYDPSTGMWSLTGNLNDARTLHTATLLSDGKVLVVGGGADDDNTLDTAELYDPGINQIPNQIDDVQFFVRQQYPDFLNRQPDADGLAFWTNEIALCGADQSCIEAKRINVSAAFFLSIEFQQTGYLVYRIYKASYGDAPGTPVPVRLSEFLPDTRQIGQGVVVNQTGWETVLENNKQAFVADFVSRARFSTEYPFSMEPAEFVDTMLINAGVSPPMSERASIINEFGSASTSEDSAARARVLRRVAENSMLNQQEFNKAFVLMQYFGYLRRNPPDPPEPTLDFQGYNFWLNKLNQFNGNFVNAEMVKAFLLSTEYRQRFGP